MSSPRLLFAVYEMPGWGGAATSRYELFARMQAEGMDVHFVNLVHSADAIFFRHMLGSADGNPRRLANVDTLVVDPPLWRSHPSLAASIDSVRPDLLVGVGSVATRMLRLAAPSARLAMLTTGSRRLKDLIDGGGVRDFIAFRRNVQRGVQYATSLDDAEGAAVAGADLIISHSATARFCVEHFFRTQTEKLYERDVSIADLVYEAAQPFAAARRPFHERDIDVLFACSSWDRHEKNLPLLRRLAATLPGRTIHVAGELAETLPAVRHGVVDRSALFDLMGRARVLACPSLFDAAPAVLFEASAMGCNVVASPNCGNHELCHPDLVAGDASAGAFRRAIERGCDRPYADNRDQFRGGYREIADTLIAFAPDGRGGAVRPRAAGGRTASPSHVERLPAFIIGGAKKCATKTLHCLLAARPDVYMPEHEVAFFATGTSRLERYAALFADATDAQLPGERSTMYFAEPEVAQRIAATLPQVKLLFVLRDPVVRAYSHYWHRVWHLREHRSFDDVIADRRNPVIADSQYQTALERYFDRFDRSQIKVVLFEELISSPERVLGEVADFLGLAAPAPAVSEGWWNRTKYPRWLGPVLTYNRLRGAISVERQAPTIFRSGRAARGSALHATVQAVDRQLRRVAFSVDASVPPMRAATRAQLSEYLAGANRRLPSLLGIDLGRWPLFAAQRGSTDE